MKRTKSVLIGFLVGGDVVVTGFAWLGLVTLTSKGYGGLELFIPTAMILAAVTLFFIVKVVRMSQSEIEDLLNG